jgi:hypothetical protein
LIGLPSTGVSAGSPAGTMALSTKAAWFTPCGLLHISAVVFLRSYCCRHISEAASAAVDGGDLHSHKWNNLFRSELLYSNRSLNRPWTFAMPLTRPIRRFYLTPPSVPLFIASLVIATLAALVHYGHLSLFRSAYAFAALMIAYLIIVIGIMFRRV